MPMPSRIQPIDIISVSETTRSESPKPGPKSRLKRLFERQFPSISRTSSIEKILADGPSEFEPNSVCLAKMVRNFIEESDKPSSGKNRCNCFNGSFTDSSDDEFNPAGGDGCEILKSLVPCASVCERNLLADTSKIVENNKNKIAVEKVDNCREKVRDELVELGYDAAICKSRWEKSPSYPAGEYEYIDVIKEGVRLIVDIDFRSEFEIARSTNSYKAILQTLPTIFVGKPERLLKMITLATEAAKQSLKKKGMPFPPWRKADYIQSKWLSAYTRITPNLVQTSTLGSADINSHVSVQKPEIKEGLISTKILKNSVPFPKADEDDCVFTLSYSSNEDDMAKVSKVRSPEVNVKTRSPLDAKVVTGFVPVINGNKP